MPTYLERLRERHAKRLGLGKPSGKRDLAAEVSALEDLRVQTGAERIEEDKPSFFYRAVDVLSGFNYALAGAYEEIASGNGIPRALGRATRELYSSFRSLPFGQALPEAGGAYKRAFGQVLENLGYGTVSLSDVFPALEGSFLGNLINTRGTVGIGLDVLTDPLTYLSFGLSSVARRTTARFAKLGVKGMSATPKGLDRMNEIVSGLRKTTPGLAEEEYVSSAARILLEEANPAHFDPGGAKFAGIVIPGTPGLGKWAKEAIGEKWLKASNVYGLRAVVKATQEFGEAVGSIFNPFGPLEKLKGAQRDIAIASSRKWLPARHAFASRLTVRVEDSKWLKYARAHPERAEAMFDMADTGIIKGNTLEEVDAITELRGLLSEIAEDGLASRVFEEGDLIKGAYMPRKYLNTDEELSEVFTGYMGHGAGIGGKHLKHRQFRTIKEGERISEIMNTYSKAARSVGINVPIMPKLKPSYDIESAMLEYIGWFATQKARTGLARELKDLFGVPLDRYDKVIEGVFDASRDVILETHKDYGKIALFFGKHKSLSKLSEEAATAFAGGKRVLRTTGRPAAKKLYRLEGWNQIVKEARHLLPTLSEPGRRQFFKEMFTRIKSEGQFVDVMKDMHGAWGRYFPSAKIDLTGELEDTLKLFGEKATYMQVGSNALWGKGSFFMPRLIVDYVNNANARLFNTVDFKEWRGFAKRWATTNNWFKTWVYPFFPSSAVRDKYSNMFLNGLRIGWHAINPSLHGHSLSVLGGADNAASKFMGGGFRSATGKWWSHNEVRELAELHNVKITGRQLFEITDDGSVRLTKKKGIAKVPEKVMEWRAGLDNEDRYALFVQDLMDGLTPEEAAADVAETLFNYNELSPFHRDFIRNMVPFSTFTIKNIKLQARMLRTNPGKVINQLKPFRGRQDEKDHMAKFDAEGLMVRVDRDGGFHALTGIDPPFRNLDVLWAGGVGPTGRRMLGMLTPILKAPLEAMSGRDFFTGRELIRTNSPVFGRIIEATQTPKLVKDWLGYRKVMDDAGRPQYTFNAPRYQLLVKSFIFSRVMSMSDRAFREAITDGNVAGMFLTVLTGLRDEDTSFNDADQAKLYRRRRQLIESLQRRGALPVYKIPGKAATEGLR